ncbi:hypothetical protein V8E51_012367 [Hyaloscypha variabilis]
MASTNGVLSPPAHVEPASTSGTLPAKRKRDDAIDLHNGDAESKTLDPSGISEEDAQALIRDLIDVLKGFDTSPSILNRPIQLRRSSGSPQAKRQKAEDGEDSDVPETTVMTRYEAKEYTTLEEVLQDIDTAASSMMDKLQPPNGAARNQFRPAPQHETELIIKIKSFKQRAHELVGRELVAAEKRASGINGQTKPANPMTNGSLVSGAFTQINASGDDNKMVLTLYGNAPGPKQLFSSLQIPSRVAGEHRDVLQTIREAGLPNGITTTKIVPIKSTGLVDDKKRVPTLGELFPTPSSVPALLPPKPSKIATTRSSTVGWYQPAAGEGLPRTASYFKQSISTGHWLDYSNASTSQGNKKKQRERALSLVGGKAPQLEPEIAEPETAKLEALFRSAYSSFAPTKDDSAAIAPTGVLDRIWWQQIGEKSYERVVENFNKIEDLIDPQLVPNDNVEDADEMKKFEELAEAMEMDPVDTSLVSLEAKEEKSAEEKDVEEILEGISELLETLNSYQRIRHMSLNASSRPAGLLSAPDTTSVGTPTKPSEPEQATYEMLKSQLTLMIASLPPYAVAKLDPDRLADLSISTKIEVHLSDQKGVMEEDEVAARAKVAAMSAASNSRAAPAANLHRSNSALYGNQYTPSRSGPPVAHNQFYGSAQTPVRPPSNPMQRPPNTAPVPYQPQRPAAGAPYRPTNYGTPAYPHQAPRPAQQPYAPSQQQYLQTPSNPYMRPLGQNYQHIPQSAPQTAMNGRYPGQQAYSHQGPPTPNAMNYTYGQNVGVNMARQASPQKPLYSPQPQSSQPRPSYSTPTPANMQDRRPFIQNAVAQIAQSPLMNGSASQSPQPFAHQSTGLTNYSTFMTAEQQESMVGRQRAQLAAQQAQLAAQQASQQQARSAAQAAIGSPSTTQVNGSNPVAAGL